MASSQFAQYFSIDLGRAGEAKRSYNSDLDLMRRFFLDAGIELIVGEYTLAGVVRQVVE